MLIISSELPPCFPLLLLSRGIIQQDFTVRNKKKKHFFFPFFTDCFFNFHCSPFCPSRSFLPCLPLIPLLFQKLSCVREMSIHLNVVQFSEHMQLQGYFLKQIRFKKKKPLSTSCSHSCHLIACSHNPSSYHLFFLLLFSQLFSFLS